MDTQQQIEALLKRQMPSYSINKTAFPKKKGLGLVPKIAIAIVGLIIGFVCIVSVAGAFADPVDLAQTEYEASVTTETEARETVARAEKSLANAMNDRLLKENNLKKAKLSAYGEEMFKDLTPEDLTDIDRLEKKLEPIEATFSEEPGK